VPEFSVHVTDDELQYLEQLVGDDAMYAGFTVRELLEHLARAAATGVRRPGSWERDWITQATGWPPIAV
jgi:hypothetical protein